MTNIAEMSERAILEMLGSRMKQERLNQNLTQEELAKRAGISRIVLTRLEHGRGCALGNLVRILRTLGKLDQLDLFLPEPGISPVQLVKLGGRQRQEASGKRGRRRPGK